MLSTVLYAPPPSLDEEFFIALHVQNRSWCFSAPIVYTRNNRTVLGGLVSFKTGATNGERSFFPSLLPDQRKIFEKMESLKVAD